MAFRPTAHIGGRVHRTVHPGKQAVWDALGSLAGSDLLALAAFAARQLGRVGLPAASAEDIVQQAAMTLAIGANSRVKGRHPRRADLADHNAFLNYLRGVISSLVDGERGLVENRFQYSAWVEDELPPLAGYLHQPGSSVPDQVAFNELSGLLYHRLRLRVPARLRRPLRTWRDQRFQSDVIPINGRHRRLRAELRSLAAEVLADLLPNGFHLRQNPTPNAHE